MSSEDVGTTDNSQVKTAGYDRMQTVALLQAFERSEMTKTDFARLQGLPRTTFTHWTLRKQRLQADPDLIAFFESPAGLRFLHRLMCALHLVFGLMGSCGLRRRALFVQLCGLEPFVALSIGAIHLQMTRLLALVVAFSEQQRDLLLDTDETLTVTACFDETFHPRPCLVAMEPSSGFLILEQYAQDATASSWQEAFGDALQELPVAITEVVADGGKAIHCYTQQHLQAPISPDLFHVLRPLYRDVLRPLSHHLKEVRQESEQAEEHLAALQAKLQVPTPPGEAYVALPEAEADLQQAAARSEKAQAGADRAAEALEGISKAYHPFDLESGSRQSATQCRQQIEARLDELQAICETFSLPERSREAVAKLRRRLDEMEETVERVQTALQKHLEQWEEASELSEEELEAVAGEMYLKRVSRRQRTAESREELIAVAEGCLEQWEEASRQKDAGDAERQTLRQEAEGWAEQFQRSTSCVEGRNAHLRRHHRCRHRLDEQMLAALKCVHNYFIRRPDGTTAAERLFDQPPADLFDFLLRRMPWPSRPAERRAETHHRFGA